MKNNTLFLTSSINNLFEKRFEYNSNTFKKIDYLKTIKQYGIEKFHDYLWIDIKELNIDLLIINLEKFDVSLNLDLLEKIKYELDIKILFVFNNSQNTFEYVDRYYAQIADLIIIDDILYIDDFYDMLEIPYIKIDLQIFPKILKKDDCSKISFCSNIRTNTIFNSDLIEFSKKVQMNYKIEKYSCMKFSVFTENYKNNFLKQYINLLIDKCFKYINNNEQNLPKVIKDTNFLFLQSLYEMYWNLYGIYIIKNSKFSFKIFKYGYINNTIKLIYFLKNKKNYNMKPYEIFDKLFYKEYKL